MTLALPFRTVGRKFETAKSREEWLQNAWSIFADVLAAEGHNIPNVQFAVGYGPRGYCKGVQGETWAKALSEDTYTIFVDPQLTDIERLLVVVAHEGAHAVDDLVSGHKGRFAKLCLTLGLDAPHTVSPLGERARGWFEDIARALGPYNHKPFTPVGTRGADKKELPSGGRTSSGRPRQKTYMVKVQCDPSGENGGCGMIMRATAKWLEDIGAPSCACGAGQMHAYL